MPVHAPPGAGRRRGRGRGAEGWHAQSGRASRHQGRRHRTPRPVRPLRRSKASPTPTTRKPNLAARHCPRAWMARPITLEQALGLLSLPRHVGIHPETKLPIEAGLGRFGPYVKMGVIFGSLDKDDDILAVGLNRAVDVLARKMAGTRLIGAHPKDGQPVQVRKGALRAVSAAWADRRQSAEIADAGGGDAGRGACHACREGQGAEAEAWAREGGEGQAACGGQGGSNGREG